MNNNNNKNDYCNLSKFEIQTDYPIPARSDLVLINKKENLSHSEFRYTS